MLWILLYACCCSFGTHLPSPCGALLYGPPGTGKSTVLRVMAARHPALHVVWISGPEVWSKYHGESEARLVKFINDAKQRSGTLCP